MNYFFFYLFQINLLLCVNDFLYLSLFVNLCYDDWKSLHKAKGFICSMKNKINFTNWYETRPFPTELFLWLQEMKTLLYLQNKTKICDKTKYTMIKTTQ